jgi:uncharacterized protein DUF6682
VILVSVIVNEARGILIDAAKVTWSDVTLISFLNEFGQNTSGVKRDLKTLRVTIPLEAGVSQTVEQVVDEDADIQTVVALLDITRNTASKKAIVQCDKALLDECNRFWPADEQELDVENFSVNVKEPTRYYVTPPNNGYGHVEATVGIVPPAVDDLTDEWPLLDIWRPAAVDFVLSRAYAQNTKKQDVVKADFYYKAYAAKIGLKTQAQIAAVPKTADPPENR